MILSAIVGVWLFAANRSSGTNLEPRTRTWKSNLNTNRESENPEA
jgi:hypothetical protein